MLKSSLPSPNMGKSRPMSNTQLKRTLDGLSQEDRFFAAAYLHHLAQSSDPAWMWEMEQTQDTMTAGRKFSLNQVQEMHEALAGRGI